KPFLMTMNDSYHRPVLLMESVDGLDIQHNGLYVDATCGGGGHSREILKRLGEGGRLFAFDRDGDALGNALDDERFRLIDQNFRYLRQYLKFYGIGKLDGVLADFGVSSHQFDRAERGFSTRFDADLDMRMDQKQELSAHQVVNTYSEKDLAGVLFHYGELRNANAMARVLVAARKQGPLGTTDQLKQALRQFLPK